MDVVANGKITRSSVAAVAAAAAATCSRVPHEYLILFQVEIPGILWNQIFLAVFTTAHTYPCPEATKSVLRPLTLFT